MPRLLAGVMLGALLGLAGLMPRTLSHGTPGGDMDDKPAMTAEQLKRLRERLSREPVEVTLKRLREMGKPAPWEDGPSAGQQG